MKKALIIGYGVSGKACEALLLKMGVEALVVDRNSKTAPDRADFPLDGIDAVILSPGVSPKHPIAERARSFGIEVLGEIGFALGQVKNRCVGVTGTNGKTTVTLLIAHVLNFAGKKAQAVGNVGTALSEYLLKPDESEILVIELSSYQLETLRIRKLAVGVYLNLTPDHLERHPTAREYAAAKARMQECLVDGGKLFVSRQVVEEFGDLFQIPVQIFDLEAGDQNILAARAVCGELGVSREQFGEALKSFARPAHRIEWVAERAGVHYYDDSKGTNIDAVMHAMKQFSQPVVLILGGVDKGASYKPWIDSFRGKVRKMVAYGEAALKMEAELSSYFPFERFVKMEEAVVAAQRDAKSGDVVLLSPGCSSYDQFRNYAERGDVFKRLVLAKEPS